MSVNRHISSSPAKKYSPERCEWNEGWPENRSKTQPEMMNYLQEVCHRITHDLYTTKKKSGNRGENTPELLKGGLLE